MGGIISLRDHETIRFAAGELSKLAGQCGISEETGYVLGTWDDCSEHGISLEALTEQADLNHAPEDAYWIDARNGKVLLSGKTERAVLFAVYAYAREQWGAHYPSPTAAEKPAVEAERTPLQLPVYSEPMFARRGFVIENVYDADFLLRMIDWLAKNRISELFLTFMLWDQMRDIVEPELAKRGMTLTLGGHSMKFFLNQPGPDQHTTAAAQENPYHSKWQFNYSDDSWQDEFCSRIASYCADIPMLTRVSMWPEDVGVNSASGEKGDFLKGYIKFTERLQRKLAEQAVNVAVEHIAYNAGLSWDMLEREGVNTSQTADTLFAYWGRDYSLPYSAADEAGLRAYEALQDWRNATREQSREFTIFEYYSDHFMMSWLFPALARRIADDVIDYKRIGVDGIVDLIVPYVPKKAKPEGTVPTLEQYDWKWIHGYNSFIFASLTWGDSLQQAERNALTAYSPEEREAVKRLLAEIESITAPITAWNVPLFPARAADPEKVDRSEQTERIAELLHQLTKLADHVPPVTAGSTSAMQSFHAYVSGLAHWAGVLEQEWRAKLQ